MNDLVIKTIQPLPSPLVLSPSRPTTAAQPQGFVDNMRATAMTYIERAAGSAMKSLGVNNQAIREMKPGDLYLLQFEQKVEVDLKVGEAAAILTEEVSIVRQEDGSYSLTLQLDTSKQEGVSEPILDKLGLKLGAKGGLTASLRVDLNFATAQEVVQMLQNLPSLAAAFATPGVNSGSTPAGQMFFSHLSSVELGLSLNAQVSESLGLQPNIDQKGSLAGKLGVTARIYVQDGKPTGKIARIVRYNSEGLNTVKNAPLSSLKIGKTTLTHNMTGITESRAVVYSQETIIAGQLHPNAEAVDVGLFIAENIRKQGTPKPGTLTVTSYRAISRTSEGDMTKMSIKPDINTRDLVTLIKEVSLPGVSRSTSSGQILASSSRRLNMIPTTVEMGAYGVSLKRFELLIKGQ